MIVDGNDPQSVESQLQNANYSISQDSSVCEILALVLRFT